MVGNNERKSPTSKVLVGSQPLYARDGEVHGGFTDLDGERFYRIANFDHLPPFFMSVVSDSDHWMFISSTGALTCGRRNPKLALFPYTTDDKIHDASGQVGPLTIVLVETEDGELLWEPFSNHYRDVYRVERNLYKNVSGNKLVFEEVNCALNLAFRYEWLISERFGFVRRARITNLGGQRRQLRLLDGLRNVLPANVDPSMQNSFSTLVDAYKISERLPDSSIGIYALSSVPVDRAEPSESLLANTVWSIGMDQATHLLSDRQLDAVRQGRAPVQEERVRGVRGGYFVYTSSKVDSGQSRDWYLVADVHQDAAAIADLHLAIQQDESLANQILSDVAKGTDNLERIVRSADGIQSGGDPLQAARHFSNTLCNLMRGGVFADGCTVSKTNFAEFVTTCNQSAAERLDLGSLADRFTHSEGVQYFQQLGDPDLERLFFEYLPLTFSRRHGDPSRPWNAFSIETRNADGTRKLAFQGNWRDIFQNWEALGTSYPEFLESMIFKFVNASTADGYNPYRIAHDGIDWEVHDPDDPWSFIGYWGDHQIIYLLKLLEHSRAFHPGRLQSFLAREIFTYANVPYRIKPYESLLANPHDTIEFDDGANAATVALADRIGADGKLLHLPEGTLVRVNLTEKLLVPLLAKLSNFIADAGIWMNTQRPEWNDANNALVGNGVSMVTLYYIRRYLDFCLQLFGNVAEESYEVSSPVAKHLEELRAALGAHREHYLSSGFSPTDRRRLLDDLGNAGCRYRAEVYRGLSASKSSLQVSDLTAFLDVARQYVDQTIGSNRRDDGLYHSYNLMQVEGDGGISVQRLDLMLEGQVAAISSGKLSARESLTVLEQLRTSPLFRPDQHSYLLYPDRDLPRFMQKGQIPAEALPDPDPRIVSTDCRGTLRFNPSLRNAGELRALMEDLNLPIQERTRLLALYEQAFHHRSFTGRSGTFFKYEGLGCIYWHMVSKLLLAVSEQCINAKASGEPPELIAKLIGCYRDIQRGIGAHKSITEQGAFPIDPYSHTPSMMGAQQPGLTGQVKEDFLIRMLELGIRVDHGCLRFDPFLLPEAEYAAGPLRFTFCGVAITMSRGDATAIRVKRASGEEISLDGLAVDAETSRQIFGRRGTIEHLHVTVP